MRPDATPGPVQPWLGINHITLATPDLAGTIAFYTDVLQMGVGFVAPPIRTTGVTR